MFLWFPVLDLARAPRRTARKKGSGHRIENRPEASLGQNYVRDFSCAGASQQV